MAPAAKARKTRQGDSASSPSQSSSPSASRSNGRRNGAPSDVDEDDDDHPMDEEQEHNGRDDDDDDEDEYDESRKTKRKKSASGKRKRVATANDDDGDAMVEDADMALHGDGNQPTDNNEETVARTEMGVIEEIYCENFMCHRKMRVQLSPHINFITGENGSGKSAIIAAIQICLGASARSTHRGKSIKNLIRHGHEGNALVRITLRNDAAKEGDAFRPKIFGKKIIVERLIRRDGSAEYRMKNEHGVMVTKLKHDLDAMLDHLNIQTENPCAILDQENAKLFLKGNPTDKYKFFLQSTDLYKMRNTYGKIDEETRALSDSVLRREKIKLASLEAAMEEAVQRWEEAQSIGKLEEEFGQLKKQLAWSFVHEKEVEGAKIAKKMRLKQKDESKIREEYEEISRFVEALEFKQKQKNDELEALNTHARELQRRKEDVRNQIREARRPLHNQKAELKQNAQQRERTLLRIQRAEEAIEQKRRKHEATIRNRTQLNDEKRSRIERQREDLAIIVQKLEAAKQQAHPPRDVMDDLDHQHETCARQLREAESEMSRLQGRISSLRSQKRDSLAVFGNRIPQLQQLIHENRHRFAAPPIGPLGLHVKLPEKYMHFAVAIEVALKGTLQSYLVVNGRDKALLDDLKRQIRCPPNQATIIIAKRSGHRYRNLRLAEGDLAAHAICNILEVSDDEVFNALIDVCSTESKLLFNDRESAERGVLRGNSGNYRIAKFVSEVYIRDGDKFVVRNGNLAYIANKGSRRSSIICQDVEGEIHEIEQRCQYLQGNCEMMRRDEARLRNERDELKNETRRQNERLDALSREYNHHRVKLRNLEEEISDDLQQNTLDTSVQEEEIHDAKGELAALREREIELTQMESRLNPDLEHLLKEVEDLTNEEDEIGRELADLQGDVDDVYKHLSEKKGLELRLEREAAAVSDYVKKWETDLARIQEECEEASDKAKHVCGSDERVEVDETHDYYGKRLTDIKRKIDKERSRFQGMDLGDLRMDKEEKELKFQQKNTTVERFAINLERVRSMLDERQRVWQILRKEIASRTSIQFNQFMNINSFAGRLKFLHDDQRLDIAVLQNDKGLTKKSQVTDMKELSGGERSYTQVSLLLALGESIECPFRVMDEFDVFMDSVNRDMTIQLLVDAAKKDARKQFIFVTPNDLSTLRRDPKVKIQKMDPPRDRLNAEQAE